MDILNTIFYVIIFLLSLTTIVTIHELGHYLLAKKAGILIHEFSIGMGPVIIRKKKGETFYALRALPLGGYVAMSGEDRENQMIKKGQAIGLILNEQKQVTEILLDTRLKKADAYGKVLSFDLFGKDMAPLFIELETSEGLTTKFDVDRKAKYIYGVKNEIQITPSESSFETKTIWQRFLVLFFGPLMNFILAIILVFTVALLQGKPSENNIVNQSSNQALQSGDVIQVVDNVNVENIHQIREALANVNSQKVTISVLRNNQVVTEEAYMTVIMNNLGIVNDISVERRDQLFVAGIGAKAKEAGLAFGDMITSINGTSVTQWSEVITIARSYDLKEVQLGLLRDGKNLSINYEVFSNETLVAVGSKAVDTRLGFDLGYEFDLLYSLYYPFVHFGESITQMIGTIGLLLNPSSGIGVGELSGPIGIFSLVRNAASQGFYSLLLFIAFLSVNIGLMNLLPIPALDGGRILFLGYEAITKKKIPAKIEFWINQISFILLLGLMIFVTFGDVGRLF